MPERQDSKNLRSDLEILQNLMSRLNQAHRPDVPLQFFLDGLLQELRKQWPDITRAEIFLQQDDESIQRQAGWGVPPTMPPAPDPDSSAARALLENKPVHSESKTGTIQWAFPLVGGDHRPGALQVEIPAGKQASETLGTVLTAFAPFLALTIQHLDTLVSQDKDLFDQTTGALKEVLLAAQRRRAYEEALSKITAQLQQQADLPFIIQQTLQELGQALGAQRARVRLQVLPPGTGKLRVPSSR